MEIAATKAVRPPHVGWRKDSVPTSNAPPEYNGQARELLQQTGNRVIVILVGTVISRAEPSHPQLLCLENRNQESHACLTEQVPRSKVVEARPASAPVDAEINATSTFQSGGSRGKRAGRRPPR